MKNSIIFFFVYILFLNLFKLECLVIIFPSQKECFQFVIEQNESTVEGKTTVFENPIKGKIQFSIVDREGKVLIDYFINEENPIHFNFQADRGVVNICYSKVNHENYNKSMVIDIMIHDPYRKNSPIHSQTIEEYSELIQKNRRHIMGIIDNLNLDSHHREMKLKRIESTSDRIMYLTALKIFFVACFTSLQIYLLMKLFDGNNKVVKKIVVSDNKEAESEKFVL